MKTESYAITDIGQKRKINQDAYLCDDSLGLYVVADGMGGHRGGEVASRMAVEEIRNFCRDNGQLKPQEIIEQAVNRACSKIYKESQQSTELAGMGTTVSVLLFREDIVFVGQVGDSRAYLLNSGGIWQITEDHSLLNEELRAGRLPAVEANSFQFKNVITRSVGYEDHVAVDLFRRTVKPEDFYLVCTDGLSGMVSANEIAVQIEELGAEKGLKRLVDMANARGGDDNITALVCQCVSEEEFEKTPIEEEPQDKKSPE